MSFQVTTKRTDRRSRQISITLDRNAAPELHDEITRLAEKLDVTRPELVRQCVRYALDHMEKP